MFKFSKSRLERWEGPGRWEGPSLRLLAAPCDSARADSSSSSLSLPPTTITVVALAPSLPSINGDHMPPGMRECVRWADDHTHRPPPLPEVETGGISDFQASCANDLRTVVLSTRGQCDCSHRPLSSWTNLNLHHLLLLALGSVAKMSAELCAAPSVFWRYCSVE